MTLEARQSAWAPVAAWLAAAPRGPLLELACRLGFASRGLLYVSAGAIALLAALDLAPRAAGLTEAVEAWARWPAGIVLVWLTGVGLWGFAIWRALQAGFDADGHGASPKGLAVRGGQAVSGLVHAGLAVSVLGALDELDDLVDEPAARQGLEQVLAWPFGHGLMLAIGVFVLATAIGGIVQAAAQDFGKRLVCSTPVCRAAVLLARLGYAGRAAALSTLAILTLGAALRLRGGPEDLATALETLEAQPHGSLILAIVAVGLAAFGLFAFVEAGCRRLILPDALT